VRKGNPCLLEGKGGAKKVSENNERFSIATRGSLRMKEKEGGTSFLLGGRSTWGTKEECNLPSQGGGRQVGGVERGIFALANHRFLKAPCSKIERTLTGREPSKK